MILAIYEAKFHALSRYNTQLMTSEEKGIRLFVKYLNVELQVLYIYIIIVGRRTTQIGKEVARYDDTA